MNPIPYGKQSITQEDIQVVTEALKADYLTQGPRISEFEKEFANYVGSNYAVAVANGTAALHLCALTLGVKPGSKVITTPITFAASANCIRYCGGDVELVDIDPETYLIDFEKVKTLLETHPKGTYQGIVPVDFSGRAVDLEKFRKLADEYGMWIIEDACHAPGGFFTDSTGQSQYCGNGNFADLAIFSFHPVKHIAAGEGGMITTNNPQLYNQLLELRTHGITRRQEAFQNTPELAIGVVKSEESGYPDWYMEMQVLGFNYRLTDFQAALGNSQLKKAGIGIEKRRKIAAKYYAAFKSVDEITDRNSEAQNLTEHAYHLYVIEVVDRLGLYKHLREHNVFTQVHYIPIHYMPYYQEKGIKKWQLPNAEAYYSRCLSLPMFPTLTSKEQETVILLIENFYKKK